MTARWNRKEEEVCSARLAYNTDIIMTNESDCDVKRNSKEKIKVKNIKESLCTNLTDTTTNTHIIN